MTKLVPMFYYPLRILFVDDDVELLKAYQSLDMPNMISTENDPIKALEMISNNPHDYINIFNDITVASDVDCLRSDDEPVISFTFDNIQKVINNNEKHTQYGIIVADYEMPMMNGLELCNRLMNKFDIIKILLTGKYSQSDSVTSLNKGVIDYFLSKGKATTPTELIECINELQLKYFKNITSYFIKATTNKFNFLKDAHFAKLVSRIISENKIHSYYMLNNTGCFLMINNQNKFILNSYTDFDLDLFCNVHDYLAYDFLSPIQQRQRIPSFNLEVGYVDIVDNSLLTCSQENKYYYNFSMLKI